MMSVLDNIASGNIIASDRLFVDNVVKPIGVQGIKNVSDQYGALKDGSKGIDILADIIDKQDKVDRRRERVDDKRQNKNAPYLTSFGKPCDPVLQPLTCHANTPAPTSPPSLRELMWNKRAHQADMIDLQHDTDFIRSDYYGDDSHDHFVQPAQVYVTEPYVAPTQAYAPKVDSLDKFRGDMEDKMKKVKYFADSVDTSVVAKGIRELDAAPGVYNYKTKDMYVGKAPTAAPITVESVQEQSRVLQGSISPGRQYVIPSNPTNSGYISRADMRRAVKYTRKDAKHGHKENKLKYKQDKFDRRKGSNVMYNYRSERKEDNYRYGDRYDRKNDRLDFRESKNEYKKNLR